MIKFPDSGDLHNFMAENYLSKNTKLSSCLEDQSHIKKAELNWIPQKMTIKDEKLKMMK